jgi:hypothetical protein
MTGIEAELAASLAAGNGQAQAGGTLAIPSWQNIHPVLPIAALSGNGTLNVKDGWGPKTGYWWDLHRISAWGFTAGTLTVYRNSGGSGSPSGIQVGVFSSVGEFTWGKGQKMIPPDDWLIFVAASITGTVQFEVGATAIQSTWLPNYLI